MSKFSKVRADIMSIAVTACPDKHIAQVEKTCHQVIEDSSATVDAINTSYQPTKCPDQEQILIIVDIFNLIQFKEFFLMYDEDTLRGIFTRLASQVQEITQMEVKIVWKQHDAVQICSLSINAPQLGDTARS